MSPRKPTISFIMATFNRCSVLAETLGKLQILDPSEINYEVIVVDNAVGQVRSCLKQRSPAFDDVRIVDAPKNLGPCAKTLGISIAEGQYTVFLDDDSYPFPGAIERMIGHFHQDPRLAAAGFVAVLPDGSCECSALPNVFIGCGVGFRTEALRAAGGLDPWFFMAAEEYDLTFRLLNAGYRVRTFDDLRVRHLKSPLARNSARTLRFDARNNAYLAARYLPAECRRSYLHDWSCRYRWLLESAGAGCEFDDAWREGVVRGVRQRRIAPQDILSPQATETLFRIAQIRRNFTELAETGCRDALFAGLGKNIYPFYRAALDCGMTIHGICDDRSPFLGRRYRGIPIVPTAVGVKSAAAAIVVSDTSPVHARRRVDTLSGMTQLPVVSWFDQEFSATPKIRGYATAL